MIFLVEYNRSKGELVTFETFADADLAKAEAARLRMEIDQIASGATHEIVLLEADSEAAIRRTHRRYFETFAELVTIP